MKEHQFSAEQAAQVLAKCCAWSAPAVILFSDSNAEVEGRFVEYDADSRLLQIWLISLGDVQHVKELRLGQYCGVSFVHDEKPYFFLSPVSDFYADGSRAMIELPQPAMIRTEMRRARRVPVLDGCLKAQLIVQGDEIFTPRVCNLSLSGVLVEFAKKADPHFEVFDKLELHLTLDGVAEVSMRAVVRRSEEEGGVCRYGLMFPETTGMADPPADLQRITKHIEELWHSQDWR